jgi:hypothetical protein
MPRTSSPSLADLTPYPSILLILMFQMARANRHFGSRILKPSAVEQMLKANADVLAGKPAFTAKSACWPGSVPGVLLRRFEPVHFIQTPKEVWIIWQFDHQVRRVYLNQPHSAYVMPPWYGESVGHYEGDELVIDTIGLNHESFVDNYRTPHTDQLHVVERFRIVEGGETLQATVTVDDPGTFNVPWSAVQRWRRVREGPLTEEICAENNTIAARKAAKKHA